jgi:hypothetical protein
MAPQNVSQKKKKNIPMSSNMDHSSLTSFTQGAAVAFDIAQTFSSTASPLSNEPKARYRAVVAVAAQ